MFYFVFIVFSTTRIYCGSHRFSSFFFSNSESREREEDQRACAIQVLMPKASTFKCSGISEHSNVLGFPSIPIQIHEFGASFGIFIDLAQDALRESIKIHRSPLLFFCHIGVLFSIF